jgi:hypothetical protein
LVATGDKVDVLKHLAESLNTQARRYRKRLRNVRNTSRKRQCMTRVWKRGDCSPRLNYWRRFAGSDKSAKYAMR